MSKNKRKNTQKGIIQLILIIVVVLILYYFLKDNSIVRFFWDSFIDNMKRMIAGQPNDWQLAAPVMNF